MVVIDGGKGQLSAGLRALQGFRERGVVVVALAKRIEEVFIPGRAGAAALAHDTPELQLLQRVRDEAHRFAITHHRIRRDRAMTASILDELPGVGPVRKRALLKHFGSPDAILARQQRGARGRSRDRRESSRATSIASSTRPACRPGRMRATARLRIRPRTARAVRVVRLPGGACGRRAQRAPNIISA